MNMMMMRRLHVVGVSGNVLVNKEADRVNSYNVWNYDEGQDSYYASMLVDLTLPPDDVSHTTIIRLGHHLLELNMRPQWRSQEFAKGEEGGKRGVWVTEVPSGVQGQTPGGVWGRSFQKPEIFAEYSTEQSHRSSQIAYCSESVYTLKKFPATTGGGTCTNVPLIATPLGAYN